jgi:hypothetical protein
VGGGGCLGLRVAAILQIYTQQSIESRRGQWGGVREDAWQGWNVWGDAILSVWSSNKWTKIMREEDEAMAVGCHHSMKGYNNQPNIGVLNGDDIGEGAQPQWNMFGGHFTFVWGDKLSGKNKQK